MIMITMIIRPEAGSAPRTGRVAARARVVRPYLSGVQTAESGVFKGPMNQLVKAEAKNYYLSSIFGEKKLTTWINLAAGVLLTLMVGGTL